ncbi:MAG: ribonuclease R [Alphaproteobacteria bacterium]
MPRPQRPKPPLPSKQQIVAFIENSDGPVGRREIARAFHIRGADRTWLRSMLKELEAEGHLESGGRKRVMRPGGLPEIAVIEVDHIDTDGEVVCRPARWQDEAPPPRIYLVPSRRKANAPGIGDRVLARLRKLEDDVYSAESIRFIGKVARELLGIYEPVRGGGILRPTDRRHKYEYFIPEQFSGGAMPGEFVTAEALPAGLNQRRARVTERLGPSGDPRSVSLVAIHTLDIPTRFSPPALAQAEALTAPDIKGRTDLRALPLVTIDGADARDFDDAVWAEPDDDPDNPGGWHLVVAIADVSWYVRPGDALDRDAYERGTSVYFPDRVVPMLPEALSNELCSLKPGVERACLAADMRMDSEGRLRSARFLRGLMRSAARLTYEQVQAARDGMPDDMTGPLRDTVIAPLYGAFRVLAKARAARGTLDLDLPERRVIFGEDGRIDRIVPRTRLDSHRLIEEMMIAANVAAAETLQRRGLPVMYRIHEPPGMDKLEALRESLQALGYKLARGVSVTPRLFAGIIQRAADTEHAQLVSDLILRSQSKAVYGPGDLGHFGLALRRYCHFTSPIRRYADILVHRALVRAADLGPGGLTDDVGDRFEELGEHISTLERRAETAERDALDRFTTLYLAERVGARFAGRISGVTRFGLFVTLHDTGADGLVPVRSLPNDFYIHDEVNHLLVGQSNRLAFRLGEPVAVSLASADTTTGSLVFEIVEGGKTLAAGQGPKRRGRAPMRRRGGRK